MTELRKTLGPVMLWGLGVGYVISGMYFGWNLGLPLGGTWGMLAATAVVTILYGTFIFSYTELACAIPRAGGAFDFGLRAFGPVGGLALGVAQIIEFLFAPPAIAAAIGAYFNLFFPAASPRLIAIGAYVVFTGLNIWGVKEAAAFELLVTVAAIAELLLFMGVTAPHFHAANLSLEGLPNGWGGAFACLPFAIWFYLGIEGVANAAEEARHPQRDVAVGFSSAMLTLIVLAIGVYFTSIGVAGWPAIVYPTPGAPPSDSPLPLAMARVVGGSGALYHLLVTVGLFGLVASFHGIVLAAGRAALELGRTGYAPRVLGRVNARTGTPVAALVANALVGIAAILSSRTAELIVLSCFGALTLYALSMVALFTLRRREPDLPRPFRAVAYPLFPAVALLLSVVSLAAMTWFNRAVAGVFAGLMAGAAGYWLAARRRLGPPSGATRSESGNPPPRPPGVPAR
jgi:ethanolamine permease